MGFFFFFSIEELQEQPWTFLSFHPATGKIYIQQMKCQRTKLKLLYDCILRVILVHKHTVFVVIIFSLVQTYLVKYINMPGVWNARLLPLEGEEVGSERGTQGLRSNS